MVRDELDMASAKYRMIRRGNPYQGGIGLALAYALYGVDIRTNATFDGLVKGYEKSDKWDSEDDDAMQKWLETS